VNARICRDPLAETGVAIHRWCGGIGGRPGPVAGEGPPPLASGGVTIERTDPPLAAAEASTLRGFLDYHRDTLRLKADGLDRERLAATHPPSTLSLGGLMKHMALVEEHWFSAILLGNELGPPWAGIDWEADPDWEFRTAAGDSPTELRRIFDKAAAASDAVLDRVISEGGLETPSVKRDRLSGEPFSLRWILLHMIEEYARHNGHADLIRESIDGSTGE
jgi:uncharacterized damage-inducible protein DinB